MSPSTGTDACEAALQEAEQKHALILTETYRAELLAVMRSSTNPAQMLRLGFALYTQALLHGDTSLCVEVLEKAAQPTKACRDSDVAV